MADNVIRDASGAITGIMQGGQVVSIDTIRNQSSQQQSNLPPAASQQVQTPAAPPTQTNVTLTPVTFSHDAGGNVVTKAVVPTVQQPQSNLPAPFISTVQQQNPQNTVLTPVTFSHDAQGNVITKEVAALPAPFISSVKQQAPTQVKASGASVTPLSAEGAEAAMNAGLLAKPFVSTAPSAIPSTVGDLGLAKPYVSAAGKTSIESPSGEILGIKVPVVSDVIAFFQPTKVTTVREIAVVTPEVTRLKTQASSMDLAGNAVTEKTYETTGGKTTIITGGIVETPSGFDLFQQNLSKQAYSGVGSLFGVSGETAKKALGVSAQIQSEISAKAPTPLNLATSTGVAELKQSFNKPVEAAVNVGIGVVFGGGTRAVGSVVGAGRAAAAEKIISTGGTWRAADVFAGSVLKNAPKVLGGIYAVDVGARATEGGTDISTRSIERLGVIAASETAPMALGFGVGYKTPSVISKAARLSDIGYKSALQEGEATGRFDYYVKQPLKTTVEVATTPITRARLEIPQFVEEAGGGSIKGFGDYAKYKVETAYRANIDIPLKSSIQSLGESSKSAQIEILRPFVGARVTGVPSAQAKLGSLSIDVARWRYGETPGITESLYGKYFDLKTSAPVKAERGLISWESALWEFGQKLKTPGITLKSLWQERGFSLVIEPGGFPSIQGRSKITNPFMWGPQPKVSETSGSTGSIQIQSKTFGGVVGDRGFSRITTRTIGGKSVGGLVKEPSLKSMGATGEKVRSDEGTSKLFSGRSVVDYRGNPASSTMKPMDLSKSGSQKGTTQAAGQISIMKEEISMPQSPQPKSKTIPVASQASQFFVPQFQQKQERTVTVIEPEFEFATTREIGSKSGVSLMQVSAPKTAYEAALSSIGKSQITPQESEVSQRKKETTLFSEITKVSDVFQSYDKIQDISRRTDEVSIMDVTPKIDQVIDITPRSDITTIPAIDKIIRTIPYTDQIITPVPIRGLIYPQEGKIPPFYPGLPSPSGGGGAGGVRDPFRKIQREILYIGPRSYGPKRITKKKKK